MNLQKCFADDQLKIVGYTPSLPGAALTDCIFFYGVDKPTACDDSVPAKTFFPIWYSAAPLATGEQLRQRTAFFAIDIPLDRTKLAAIITRLFTAGRDDWWGHFYYWKGLPQRTPDSIFPSNGRGATVGILNLWFACKGAAGAFETLDDFVASWEEKLQRLSFVPKQKSATTQVTYFDKNLPASSPGFFLRPTVPFDFVAGAIEAELPWSPPPNAPNAFAPADLIGFLFQAEPANKIGKIIKYNIWQSNLIHDIKGDGCRMALDPRDGIWQGNGAIGWNGNKQNSRLDFIDSLLHSHFFDLHGRRLALQCHSDVCAARLATIVTQKLPSGLYRSAGSALFQPHGDFEIISSDKIRSARGKPKRTSSSDDQQRLIVGAASTEYLQIPLPAKGTGSISFESNHPALFVKPPPGSVNPIYSNTTYLDDENGVFVTSWLKIGGAAGGASTSSYFSQSAQAPLFSIDPLKASQSLGRVDKAIGQTAGKIIPIFPWAGLPPAAKNARSARARSARQPSDIEILKGFELSHLSPERLRAIYLKSIAPTSEPAYHKRQLGLRPRDNSKAVTPQGLLADTDANGNYVKLYFGNPNGDGEEFYLKLNQGSSTPENDVFNSVQAALRQNQLFLLIQSPSTAAIKVIEVSASIKIRKFTFTTHLNFTTDREPVTDADKAPILLVKYFTGKSLKELVKGSMWYCGLDLASKADSAKIQNLVDEAADEYLNGIWTNPNWQGVLMLNLPKPDMQPMLKALEPGMLLSNLRVSYCGLSALPVNSQSLTAGTLSRPVSAFALIKYTPPAYPDPNNPILGENPDSSAEKEPLPPPPSPSHAPKPLSDRGYQFIVKDFSVNFLNSQISKFTAKVDVSFGYLFWDPITQIQSSQKSLAKDAGKTTIALTGHYESRPAADGQGTTDVFSLTLDNSYTASFTDESCLKDLTFTRGSISVIGDDTAAQVLTVFVGLTATATFNESRFKLNLPLFDIGAKKIIFDNFGFQYQYYYDSNAKKFPFQFDAGKLSADIDINPNDEAKSVLAALPLQLKKIHVAIGDMLDLISMGFTAIVGGGSQSTFHFGLEFDLDLGFFGKLVGDFKQFKIPLLLGWGGGTTRGLVFGIQFPKFSQTIDIGIQQFVKLHAQTLTLQPCWDSNKRLRALAIAAGGASLTILGKEFPAVSFAFFISLDQGRKISWAVGYAGQSPNDFVQYIGAGHRITFPPAEANTKAVVDAYRNTLTSATDPCKLLGKVDQNNDGWVVALQLKVADFIQFWLALADASDNGIYGVHLEIDFAILKGLTVDLFYRRVNDALGILSGELGVPDIFRTIQFGAASFRLPIIRIEIHTDGGYLLDFGFPWNNDFSRSCQLEIAIFVGGGGFYYGKTAMAANSALVLTGPLDVYNKPSDQFLKLYNCLQCGIAVRVGIGRSFTIGILNADATITVFGGLEGAVGYPKTAGPFAASAYYIKGYVGLMLDIHASVNFGIVCADAYIRAYAMIVIELAKVAASYNGQDGFLTKPIRLAAVVGLEVGVQIVIGVGCVSVTITLHFSATWEFDETIGSLQWESAARPLRSKTQTALAGPTQPFTWKTSYLYWQVQPLKRSLNIYVTILPCMAAGRDVQVEQQTWQSCVVGQMWLAADADKKYGLLDLAKFLTGWVLRPDSKGIDETEVIQLDEVIQIRSEFKAREEKARNGGPDDLWGPQFEAALQTVLQNQFAPIVTTMDAAKDPVVANNGPFASIPFWYGTTFGSVTGQRKPITMAKMSGILHRNEYTSAEANAMAGYARCAITALLTEVQKIIEAPSSTSPAARKGRLSKRLDHAAAAEPPDKSMTWSAIWTAFAKIQKRPDGK
jgi:hypothetical protein